MHSGIYSITNTVNGSCYVGSAVDIERRWRHHKSRLRHGKHSNPHLQSAFDLYGESAFAFAILEECDLSDVDLRIVTETAWIGRLSAQYNMAPVGGCTIGVSRPLSVEHRAKISAFMRGRKQSQEHIRKRAAATSATTRGRPVNLASIEKFLASNKAANKSPEWIAKIAEAKRGARRTEEQKKRISDAVKASWALRKAGKV